MDEAQERFGLSLVMAGACPSPHLADMAQGPGSIPGEVDAVVVTAAMGSQQCGTTTALDKGTGLEEEGTQDRDSFKRTLLYTTNTSAQGSAA